MAFGLAGNDQRGAGFIDQDRIDFIDDREVEVALHAVAGFEHHVVAQVIETEFVVGAVGDVGGISLLLQVMRHLRQVHAGGQAEPAVQAIHPFGVALGQVIVDRHHMHALAGQRIQIGGQRGHQGFTFAGAHFRDLAVMQDHAADQLHVEMAHLQHALAGLAADREGFRQDRVERLALGDARLQFGRLGLQFGIRQLFQGRFQRIDLANGLLVLLEQPLVAATENLGQ
jgi:hypothetical protein